MSRLSFLPLERNPVLKTGIFLKIAIASIVISVFFLSSCTSTSYFEEKKGTAGTDTERTSSAVDVADDQAKVSEEKEEKIFVEIRGAVNAPGVFEVEKGSRVFSLISMAGGLSDVADTKDLNQAKEVLDGEKIYIRSEGEQETVTESSMTAEKDGRININTADAGALKTLPGIGEAKAKLIIDYRQKNGPFKSTEDVTKISGIKGGLYEKIKDRITV